MKSIIEGIPKKRISLYVLVLIIMLDGIIRVGLLGVPLERDEGEYAYAGQLILQGVPPYQEVFNMKLPGIYAAYAFFMAILGQTHQGIHLALLIVNAITIILIYFLAKHIVNQPCALISAAGFAVLSLGQSVQGVYAHAEHFVIMFAMGGLLLMLRGLATENPVKLFLAGVLLCLGFMMKQHGIAFIALALVYIAYDSLRKRPILWRELMMRLFTVAGGVLTVLAILCMIMIWTGVFSAFRFWTIDYASTYITQIPINKAWSIFITSFKPIVFSAPLLWILVGAGFLALAKESGITRPYKFFLLIFAVFSILSICPGFYFRGHYFVLLLPWAGVFAGITIYVLIDFISKFSSREIIRYGAPVLLVAICLFQSIYKQRDYLFNMTYFQISRSTCWLNPFHESLNIAEFLKGHTGPEDRIAIFGSEPQIFFYSKRRSASSYIYMYPMMEKHDFALSMQKDFIKNVEATNPKYILYVNVPTSWLMTKNSHKIVLEWLDNYLQKGQTRLVGLVELSDEKSSYYWYPDVKWPATSKYWVAIFERR